ncbi:7007_t:CDS:2 [Entrophospora sp. SA101]|nr:7007_t:CDS:2 [Entrophospora sp. SA101]CAJ0856358.1 10317_t:CDS:2 [Entrophospora sp. SA101]
MYMIDTPISTSAKIIEGKDARILEELSRKYSTRQLIEYLKLTKKVYETDHDIIFSFIIAIEEVRKWEAPHAKYFKIFPNDWSLNHYIAWVHNNMNKEMANRTFYRVLETINNDQSISQEFHNVAQEFLKRKKSNKASDIGDKSMDADKSAGGK